MRNGLWQRIRRRAGLPTLDQSNAPQNEAHDQIRLSYFLRVKNIGDQINPALVSAVTGRDTIWWADRASDHLVAVGSVMAATTPASYVWGAGVMHPSVGIGDPDPARVLAVRGKLTHAEFSRAHRPIKDVPLGDPGFLIGRHFGQHSRTPVGFELGIVPHYVDWGHPIVDAWRRWDGVTLLDVREPQDSFLRRMASCRAVVSSSLHGLVFAEALGIPNLWIELSDKVVGDGFKFHDWFSVARQPQKTPFRATSAETAHALRARCMVHEMAIDAPALEEALTESVANAVAVPKPDRRSIRVSSCRARPVPIFVISFNRAVCLDRTIASYRRLATPVEIIVHDNGSDQPETLAILQKLEREGVRLYRRGAIREPDELNRVNETVAEYFADWCEPCRYVVTDCDVDLDISRPDALCVFDELLDRFPQAECVGPMLRISDIPDHYPLFNRVMNRHIEQFWCKDPQWAETDKGRFAYLACEIDTTFALHRAGEPFRRLKRGLRIYHPFEARHLDWYADAPLDEGYCGSSSSAISHWNNRAQLAQFATEPLVHQDYKVIEPGPDGALRVALRRVPMREEG